MHKSECYYCCFFDRCTGTKTCGFYSPAGASAERDYDEKLIEAERKSFREEYYEYIERFYD